MRAFPFLLLPSLWASRNRARRRETRRPAARRWSSAASASAVIAALFGGAFWVTWQAAQYAELGDYLIRIGLSWLFLTFLSFLAFSGVVTALSTFFLSDDLRLVLAAPVAARRVFHGPLRAHRGAGRLDGGGVPGAGARRRRPRPSARRRRSC